MWKPPNVLILWFSVAKTISQTVAHVGFVSKPHGLCSFYEKCLFPHGFCKYGLGLGAIEPPGLSGLRDQVGFTVQWIDSKSGPLFTRLFTGLLGKRKMLNHIPQQGKPWLLSLNDSSPRCWGILGACFCRSKERNIPNREKSGILTAAVSLSSAVALGTSCCLGKWSVTV